MEIGKQIKKYRNERHLSQEELADKVFVTRQTISNWETDKSYPDINSIVLLSQLFGISLDAFLKGDIEDMKEKIQAIDIQRFKRDSIIYSLLLIITIGSVVPLLVMVGGYVGVIAWIVILLISLSFAIYIEKQKKTYHIQTYKEIVAFMEGKRLDEIEKYREEGKRPYQIFVYMMIFAVIGFVVTFGLLNLIH